MTSSRCKLGHFTQMIILLLFILSISEECYAKYKSACSVEFTLVGSKCYHFSKDERNWNDAYYNCVGMNSSLAILATPREDRVIKRYLKRYNEGLGYNSRWIGGKFNWNNGSWIWAETGETISAFVYHRALPKDKNSLQWSCLEMDSTSMHKFPRSCLMSQKYICQKEPNYQIRRKRKFNIKICKKTKLTENQKRKCIKLVGGFGGIMHTNAPAPKIKISKPIKKNVKEYACPPNMFIVKNRCYYFSHKQLNWHGAYWACRDNKTNLAVIQNEGQDKMLDKILSHGLIESHERWIGGLYDWKKERWLWADSGNPIKYKGFPFKNYVGSQFQWRGITIDPNIGYLWNARLLTERKHFICQCRAKPVVKLSNTAHY